MDTSVGKRIRKLRLAKQLQQKHVARGADLADQRTLWRIETGRKTPTEQELVRIAEVLGVTTDELTYSAAQLRKRAAQTQRGAANV